MDPRDASLRGIIERIGTLNREFVARGTYPFAERGLGRSRTNLLFAPSRTVARRRV